VPEPAPESAAAASTERAVDFSRPPIEGTVVGGIVEPETDRNAPPAPTGWRVSPHPAERSADAPAARDVVIPEIVNDPAARWATPPTAEPVIDLTADDPGAPEVEVVEARQPASQPSLDLPARTRAVRVKTVRTDGKRRWVVDVLVKQPEADDEPK